jgi:hypothetical protein
VAGLAWLVCARLDSARTELVVGQPAAGCSTKRRDFLARNGHPRSRAEPERKLLGLIESVVAGPTWEGATKLSASDRDPLPNHRHIGLESHVDGHTVSLEDVRPPAAPETLACVESKKQHGYMRTTITARGNTCRDRFFSLDDVERETFRLLSGRPSRGG